MYNKAPVYFNELLLTPSSTFHIKYKKLNAKNLWKCIFRASRRVCVSYFPKILLDHGVGGAPQYLLEFFVNQVTIFNSSPMEHLRWTSL